MNDNRLAVDDSLAGEVERASNNGESLGPVQPVAGEDALLAAVDVNLHAVAVVLNFVQTLLALGGLGLQGGELGFNEPRHCLGMLDSTHKRHLIEKNPPHSGYTTGLDEGLGDTSKA